MQTVQMVISERLTQTNLSKSNIDTKKIFLSSFLVFLHGENISQKQTYVYQTKKTYNTHHFLHSVTKNILYIVSKQYNW